MRAFSSRLAIVVALVGALACGTPRLVWAQATIGASNIQVNPGGIGVASIAIALPVNVRVVTMQFNLTVAAVDAAPALEAPISFVTSSAVPRPNFNMSETPATVLIAWLQEIAPPLTGQVEVGTLSVPIPAAARPGDRYRIEVLNPSGASDRVTGVSFSANNGELTVAAAASPCVGDCDGNLRVAVNELVLGVNIALEKAELTECAPFDESDDSRVSVSELIQGVNNALAGCAGTP